MRLDARLCVDKLPCRHATAQLHNRAKGFQYKPLRMQSKMLYEILKGFLVCLILVRTIWYGYRQRSMKSTVHTL